MNMMIRSFLPVGQGAFYCEQFMGAFETERINIVYDCGSSTNVKLVEEQIKNNFEKDEIIHAVFISHFDNDHINGIPFLLKYCKVKKIFFPLLTESNGKYIILYNLIKNNEKESFTSLFVKNPYEALGQLNIGYSPRLYQISENEQRGNRIDAITIPSGENIADIIFENTIFNYDIYRKWVYIPYNFRQTDRIKQLRDELNQLFGKSMNNEDIQEIWANGTAIERENIKNSYKAVKGSFNTNSMILYSGTKERCLGQREAKAVCYKCCCNCDLKNIGCLYLGDYDASGEYKWKELMNAYGTYWNNIGCVQIPHHGSKYNYNKELAKLDAYYIISAGMNNGYQHPHSMVIKDLLFNRNFPYIITENKSSELHLVIDI